MREWFLANPNAETNIDALAAALGAKRAYVKNTIVLLAADGFIENKRVVRLAKPKPGAR